MIKVSGVGCQVSGVSQAAGLKSGQFERRGNFFVTQKSVKMTWIFTKFDARIQKRKN
jgi:hypothetical protein